MFTRMTVVVCAALAASIASPAGAQPAAAGIPRLSAEQLAALGALTADLAPLVDATTAARDQLVAATLTSANPAVADERLEALRTAERALATARADAFVTLQRSPARLTAPQVEAFAAMGGSLLRTNAARGGNPDLTAEQRAALTRMASELAPLTQGAAAARANLAAATLRERSDRRSIESSLDTLVDAERRLAEARAAAFAAIERSPLALAPHQLAALTRMGGTLRAGGGIPFTEPDPIDFNDREGYVSLFDGKRLTGWDGNPKFWRVENGAIVGESTVENPSGNSYLAYRGIEAKDFTLKLEIRIDGSGGSGIQYRSKTGLPWLANIPANVGPANLDWMMTGPQADFWPATPVYTGQFYSENTPMRILAWRGQVVEAYGNSRKRLMGTIGDRDALGRVVKMNDWNQYTIIARGGTFIHILNGQLLSVFIDDDPASSNNQTGEIGIEIEATTKVSVRNIWLKQLK